MNLETTVKESFSVEVEKYARYKELTLLESLVIITEKYGVLDKITSYVSRPLKEKLELEATLNRQLKSKVIPVSLF